MEEYWNQILVGSRLVGSVTPLPSAIYSVSPVCPFIVDQVGVLRCRGRNGRPLIFIKFLSARISTKFLLEDTSGDVGDTAREVKGRISICPWEDVFVWVGGWGGEHNDSKYKEVVINIFNWNGEYWPLVLQSFVWVVDLLPPPGELHGELCGYGEHGGMELQKSIWGEGACSGQAFKNFQFYHHHIQYTVDRRVGGGSGWEHCYIMYSMYLQDGQNLVGEFYFSLGPQVKVGGLTFEIWGHKVNLITVDLEFRNKIARFVISIHWRNGEAFFYLTHLLIKLVVLDEIRYQNVLGHSKWIKSTM